MGRKYPLFSPNFLPIWLGCFRPYTASYLNDHKSQYADNGERDNEGAIDETGDARTSDTAAVMAAGRLDWLLRETCPSMSCGLSERDIVALLDCSNRQIFSPDNFDSIAAELCDHFRIEPDLYGTSRISPLVDTRLDLSAIQRLTLADALEQTGHRGMKQENMSPKDSSRR